MRVVLLQSAIQNPKSRIQNRVSAGVPGTPYLTAWANSRKSGRASREQALRRMASGARLERLALSASGHERMVKGPTAASKEQRIDFSAGIAWFGDILNRGVRRH